MSDKVPYHAYEKRGKMIDERDKRIEELESLADLAWGIIANVSEGDWREQKHEWETAATRWRDDFLKSVHPPLKEEELRARRESPQAEEV